MTLVWSTAAAAATAQLTASSAAKLDPRAALRCGAASLSLVVRCQKKKKQPTTKKPIIIK